MTPEQKARQQIDVLLRRAGWTIQDVKQADLSESIGVAVREYPLESGHADYLLFVNRQPVGAIEAKPTGTTLSGVSDQTDKYLTGQLKYFPNIKKPLRFGYESTGVETFFRDLNDPDVRSRRVFAFHKPETLLEWQEIDSTLRTRLQSMPILPKEGLRDCQFEAITNLEQSFSEARPRALIQMATGSGKTYTAVSFVYRLIKFAGARRVLFLVDRNNLGRQTLNEFQQYVTPDDHRKFTELYNIQHLSSNVLDPVSKVCITTIQRLYSMLKGEPGLDPSLEEISMYDISSEIEQPKEVEYDSDIPIETFDFIVTDECHRSIYHLWRQVLEYFDGFIIGLTATPSKQTFGFFNQNLVMEYSHERAVADGVNVGYEVYRIKTEITEQGSRIDAGYYVDKRNKLSRKVRWERVDDSIVYTSNQLDRDIVASDQIRTVIKTFKQKLFTEIFPGRTEIPKTLIFAKDDSHAEDIVGIVREEFGKGNEFCKKITYRTTGEKPEDLIASFRNSYHPRIAVTVDMVSTGTDIKPLECLLFMRDVRSIGYFDQMKGRGTRTISTTEFANVTPDARYKTRFVIVDAVGVCESDKTDSRPLDRKRHVPFDKLILGVALGGRDEDSLTSLAARLAKLDRELEDSQKERIQGTAKGISLTEMINHLLDSVDPDKQVDKAAMMFSNKQPTEEQVGRAKEELIKTACLPFDDPQVRDLLSDMRRETEQTIDTVSKDHVVYAGGDDQAAERARSVIKSFKSFIETNKSEILALQILYSAPYGTRHLTYEAIEQLAGAIRKPPYLLAPEKVWHAYEQLERSRVRGSSPQTLLTDIISLVRFAIGKADELLPYSETVNERFRKWVIQQENVGREFTQEQMQWLLMIKDHIATSLKMEPDDFELSPFKQHGGLGKVYQLFGDKFPNILEDLNETLAT